MLCVCVRMCVCLYVGWGVWRGAENVVAYCPGQMRLCYKPIWQLKTRYLQLIKCKVVGMRPVGNPMLFLFFDLAMRNHCQPNKSSFSWRHVELSRSFR